MFQVHYRVHKKHVMEKKLKKIIEEWYLSEPALFTAACTHSLAENRTIEVPMRSGQQMIEYNPEILSMWDMADIKERMRLEVIRIMLGHPYQRQPYPPEPALLGLASDVTLKTLYDTRLLRYLPEDMKVPKGLCFEEYYSIVRKYLNENGIRPDRDTTFIDGSEVDRYNGEDNSSDMDGSGKGSGDGTSGDRDNTGGGSVYGSRCLLAVEASLAGLWQEDMMMQEHIRQMVDSIQRSRQWGSIPAAVYERIIASNMVRIDYRNILSMFRASVLCSRRSLTRMRPSRRYGFGQMGSKRDFATRLLVAMDVSGSVGSECLSQALSIINRFFKYGVESVDVIQFDAEIKGEKQVLKKAVRGGYEICGRGGTDFQPPVDMFLKESYDGLIMITDGYAPAPELSVPHHGRILWMIYASSSDYQSGDLPARLSWIADFPSSGYLILPKM